MHYLILFHPDLTIIYLDHHHRYRDLKFKHDRARLPVSYKSGPHWGVVVTRSNFKSETIFGFLIPDYTGQCT